ncbi:hypothetical protein Tsubulata_010923 [Turnera subulata]|uniref:PCI domain-containing protein n=1 Tax=Turnera subulata TaxID=218843 RepID=A0A9Q0F4M6_9ROSI|nr:hypothetical protein Tsubulata_010923 [Turnera subulata]
MWSLRLTTYYVSYCTSSNNRDLVSSSRLTEEAKKDDAVNHALAVCAAVTSGNYVIFFRLYKMAPNLNTCLMDLCVEKMRYKAVSCMSRAYPPTIPISYVAEILGFSCMSEGNSEKGSNGIEECEEWLRAHCGCIIADNNGEMQLDTKASSSSLYMPEPEDAMAHGPAMEMLMRKEYMLFVAVWFGWIQADVKSVLRYRKLDQMIPLRIACDYAIRRHNKKEKTNLKSESIIKANMVDHSGMLNNLEYYITLKAKNMSIEPPEVKTYRAKVGFMPLLKCRKYQLYCFLGPIDDPEGEVTH